LRPCRQLTRPDSEERGAVAVAVAGIMVVVLGIAAFTVDLGMQRIVARDMQALSDVVALDVSRHLDSATTADVLLADATFKDEIIATVDRNAGSAVGDAPRLTIEAGRMVDGTFTSYGSVSYLAGSSAVGPPVAAQALVPNAIKVSSLSTVGFAFGGIVGSSSGDATRSAVGSQRLPSVCFSVGAKALTLNTDQSALSPLLNQILSVNLSAVGYEGLVSLDEAYIPLADLLVALDVGAADDLATTTVTLDEFFLAVAEVAGEDTVTADVLGAITLGAGETSFTLADILSLGTATGEAGLDATLNVLGVLGAAIVAANGENAIAVEVPGLTELTIVEPPKIACGARGATATSAQIRLRLQTDLVAGLVPGLVGGTTDISINVGAATAMVDADITCLPDTVTMTTTTGGVQILPPVAPAQGQVGLDVTVATFLDAIPGLGTLLRIALQALGLSEVSLDVLLEGSVASATETKAIVYDPPPAEPPSVTFPEGGLDDALAIDNAEVFLSTGQGGLLSLLTSTLITNTLNVLLDSLVEPLIDVAIDPLLTAVLNALTPIVGLQLGTADVEMLGRPVCQSVTLVG